MATITERIEAIAATHGSAKSPAVAARLHRIMDAAQSVLNNTPVGEGVVFEGSCPSGSTYSRTFLWDGSDSCRERIIAQAVFDYPNDALRRERDVRGGIAVADMRTSNL